MTDKPANTVGCPLCAGPIITNATMAACECGILMPLHAWKAYKTRRTIIEKHQQPSVSALEAENERLREALAGFINWSSGHGHHELNTLRREGLAILNREQEKQP